MHHRRHILRYTIISLACVLALLAATLYLATRLMQPIASRSSVAGAAITQGKTRASTTAPTPFMYRPYYGTQTIGQRTTSFVDHDKPWYVSDGTFIRYDGQKWTNVPIGSCTGGVNCYDGHDGYDLNLWFEPVLSVASGTVIRAGWYNPANHLSAYGLWVAIDHHNGYATAYGHLSALMVSNGENVGTQWQVGTSGTTGSSTGPHLHLATYYLPNWNATDPFGWTGNYPDPNVVPDNYLWVSNPGTGYTIPDLSGNGSAVYPGATMVDDGGTGWSSTGTWTQASATTDINGKLHWVATTSGTATATATWQPNLPTPGYYEVGVYVDDNNASSGWAPYTITSADPNNPSSPVTHTIYVDEEHIGSFPGPFGQVNTGPQWVSLGTYYFDTQVTGNVALTNATGETGLQITADGVEFAPATIPGQPPASIYSFQMSSDGTPGSMSPGSTNNVNLTIQNTGNFTWNASGSSAVQLTYQWLNAQNQAVCSRGQNSHIAIGATNPGPCPPVLVSLPQDVAPNASVSLTVPVRVSVPTGTYTLQWNMVQGATVFSQHGAQVKNDPVSVSGTTNGLLPFTTTSSLPKTYYFAEGYTGAGTTEYLSLTNPSTSTAHVTITFLYQGRSEITRDYTLSAQSQRVLNINQEAGANQSQGMIVRSDQPFVAERTMYTRKGAFVAASDSPGSSSLSTTWYFADGNTTYGWNTLLAVLNPASQVVNVTVHYLTANGLSNTSSSFTVAARSRGTLVLNDVARNQQFGMAITASVPVLIERPEFLVAGSLHGGNSVVGATSPRTTWYFGGGNTTSGFNEQLVLANPSTTTASVQLRYLTAGGQVVTQNAKVPALSRIQVNANSAVSQALHGTVINASVPIVAERQDFFNTLFNGPVTGSTITMGSPGVHSGWFLAHGDTSAGHAEYLALTNPGTTTAHIKVVYYLPSGAPIVKTCTLAPSSRMTLKLSSDIGSNTGVGIGISASVPVALEEIAFFNVNGTTGGYVSEGVGVN